jgi:hypothetical protein
MKRQKDWSGIFYPSTLLFPLLFLVFSSCSRSESAEEIVQNVIDKIDKLETISYKQDMWRSDPANVEDSIFRYREMIFKRLPSDSIVGVQGHWYLYVNDKKNVIYEDIYDGKRLVRKNNRDSIARIYDLVKYPAFKQQHFGSHQSPYGIQYTLKYILNNSAAYHLSRSSDTLINGKSCFQIKTRLENQMSMPGFMTKIEDREGNFSSTLFVIDQENYYPVRIKNETHTTEYPGQNIFIDQKYYDISFNPKLEANVLFNTSDEAIKGYKSVEMQP